jgi:hypothetical protein
MTLIQLEELKAEGFSPDALDTILKRYPYDLSIDDVEHIIVNNKEFASTIEACNTLAPDVLENIHDNTMGAVAVAAYNHLNKWYYVRRLANDRTLLTRR